MRKVRDKIADLQVLWVLLFTILYTSEVQAKFSARYNEQNPLVIVCDWDMPPYEFLDDNGQPAGFTVDLLDVILPKLNIPYVYEMKENLQVKQAFQKRKADLIIAPSDQLKSFGSCLSATVLCYFRPTAVIRKDMHELKHLSDVIDGEKVVLREGDSYQSELFRLQADRFRLEYHAPMEALAGVAAGRYDYFIWGEEPLKWKLRELNLDSLVICDIGLPMAEVHFGGYDQELIEAIDDQYARLEQKGDLGLIRDKWFHPERVHGQASPVFLYIAIAAGLLLLALFLLNRLIQRRVKSKMLKHSEQTRLMNMALDMGGYMVAEYNAQQDAFKNVRGQLMNESSTMEEAVNSLHPEDVAAFMDKVEELRSRSGNSYDLFLRRNQGTADQPLWQYLTGNCIKEVDEEQHRVSYLLVAKDITSDMDEQTANKEMAAMYNKAFDIALVAMSFYSPDGKLLAMNEQMKQIIGTGEQNQQFFWDITLFDAPLFREVLLPGMTEAIHACQHMYYPELGLDKYLEYRVRPAVSDEGEIRYYVVTVRDTTAERNLYMEQQATERQLMVTNSEVNKFEAQMNDLLSNSGMFIWRSHYEDHSINISRSLRNVEHSVTFDDYLSSLSPEELESAHATFFNPLSHSRPLNFVRHFKRSPINGKEGWFAISGMSYQDKTGKNVGHFGIVRDVTKLVRSQEELRRETAQAQQSSQLKATFLANMTHEIRTPLNAIVGFSDLLHTVTIPEERQEFIRIIRHNCDLLLRLIDDILETSYMDERPQSIEPEDIDFSTFFNEVCHTVAQRVTEPAVEFLADNPFQTFPARIDKERIQQVITNFVTNAVKYTQKGHIKVGYRDEWVLEDTQKHEGIYIYCEDTGTGIPREKQASVFDRFVKLNDFVQGTGLGLSICKSIAERCNGRIGLESDGEGMGSTFWLWIPRYLTLGNLTAEK